MTRSLSIHAGRLRGSSALLLILGLALVTGGCRTTASGGASGAAGAAIAPSGAPSSGGSVAGAASGGERAIGAAGTAAGVPGGGSGSGASGAQSGGGTGFGGASPGVAGGGSAGFLAASGGAGGTVSIPPHTGMWRITPLGDSITGNTCGPQLLSKALIDHGKTNFTFIGSNLNNQSCNGAATVQTEGHGGYLVTDLVGNGMHATELPNWCASNKADLVLMQFGTNDVWNDRSPSSILDAYSTVLTTLRSANPQVILLVAQITPLNPSGCAACESRVTALNSQIPAWASRNSTATSPVLVVDLHSAFDATSYTSNSTYTGDGVHPNTAGAQLIANKWYEALVALGLP